MVIYDKLLALFQWIKSSWGNIPTDVKIAIIKAIANGFEGILRAYYQDNKKRTEPNQEKKNEK